MTRPRCDGWEEDAVYRQVSSAGRVRSGGAALDLRPGRPRRAHRLRGPTRVPAQRGAVRGPAAAGAAGDLGPARPRGPRPRHLPAVPGRRRPAAPSKLRPPGRDRGRRGPGRGRARPGVAGGRARPPPGGQRGPARRAAGAAAGRGPGPRRHQRRACPPGPCRPAGPRSPPTTCAWDRARPGSCWAGRRPGCRRPPPGGWPPCAGRGRRPGRGLRGRGHPRPGPGRAGGRPGQRDRGAARPPGQRLAGGDRGRRPALALALEVGYSHPALSKASGATAATPPAGPWLQPLADGWSTVRTGWHGPLRAASGPPLGAETVHRAADYLLDRGAAERAVPLYELEDRACATGAAAAPAATLARRWPPASRHGSRTATCSPSTSSASSRCAWTKWPWTTGPAAVAARCSSTWSPTATRGRGASS